jgi:tRNA uridine 5-carbamoylmethylation protein Kti12
MAHYIGITGTHSTGKTTFTDLLTEKAQAAGLSVIRVGDIATECRNEGFGILKDHTFESTLWIMTAVINAELKAGLEHDLVIVDRPVQDALGYLEAALVSTDRQLTTSERDYLYGLARLHVPRYIVNFKTTLDNSIALGEDRDPDRDFRTLVDQTISKANDALGIDARSLTESEATLAINKVLQ